MRHPHHYTVLQLFPLIVIFGSLAAALIMWMINRR